MREVRKKKKRGTFEEFLIRDLDDLGFDWELDSSVMWDRSFEQLKCYKKSNGHCVVGRSDGEKYSVLKRWVSAQRAAFGSGKLSEERIQALNELGFQWVAPRGRKKKVLSETAESEQIIESE